MKQKRRSYFIRNNWPLYTMILPGLLCFLVFCYFPIYGIVMAFQNFKPTLGFFRSEFVGLKHFERIANDAHFFATLKNTVVLGAKSILIGFPAPILLALLFNEVRHSRYKRAAQTISYMPYFLSTVIVIGLMRDMLSVNDGVVNMALGALGARKIDFFLSSAWFRTLYIGSGLWQGIGWGTIIYLAAIAGINSGASIFLLWLPLVFTQKSRLSYHTTKSEISGLDILIVDMTFLIVYMESTSW